jgi:hypothetical protein
MSFKAYEIYTVEKLNEMKEVAPTKSPMEAKPEHRQQRTVLDS